MRREAEAARPRGAVGLSSRLSRSAAAQVNGQFQETQQGTKAIAVRFMAHFQRCDGARPLSSSVRALPEPSNK
jgi:hypothetical protein